MKTTYCFIACLLLFGCKQATNNLLLYEEENLQGDTFSRTISIDVLDENNVLKYSDVFDYVNFIKLETTDDAIIGRVDKIIALDDKYIILDSSLAKKVFVFDSSGQYLNSLGKIGQGPGEFESPHDIAFNKYTNELLIWSHNDKKILRFKLDGTFVSELKIDWWISSLSVIAPDAIVLYLNNITQKASTEIGYNIVMIDYDGNILNKMMPIENELKRFSPPSKKVFSLYNDNVLFSPQFSRGVYTVDTDSISQKYFIDFGEMNIHSSLIRANTLRDLYKLINKHNKYAFSNSIIETEHHVYVQAVYKNKLFDCYYSKESNSINCTSLYLNDMKLLAFSGVVMTAKQDTIISIVQPDAFTAFLDYIEKENNIASGGTIYKKLLSSSAAILGSAKNNYKKLAEESDFELSKSDIGFIKSINSTDNPIIRLSTLKTIE
ncbi:6-bladed beta-propeller [Bacteroides sp. 214]|uniref:6-bladed beta-propeller n=1 Tax=Bacteroides sp. 214 TaxID=2302935 RepID=UPI0013D0F38B|nr:6-bladed beta-propeller [Bacteroides sp. 214]